jgi:serine protease AprX
MARSSACLVLILFAMAFPASGGEGNRYMVFFKDKSGSAYSLETPEEFLSKKALERRSTQNIKVNSSDLPVSSLYVRVLNELDGVDVYFTTKWMNGVLVETEETVLEDISTLPFVDTVEYVAPGQQLSASGANGRNSKPVGNNRFSEAAAESSAQNEFIGVGEMHELGFKGEGMTIAIFDSGFKLVNESPYYAHLFQNDKIGGTRDFIKNSDNVFQYDSHGAKVISCISAFEEDVYAGTAPEANIVFCVTEDVGGEYRIEEYNWLFAAEYADSIGVDIISSSVGYSYFNDESMDYTYEDFDGKTTVITKAATQAASKGMLVVNSIGNEGNSSWTYLNAPADADSILSVGSVTYDGIKSGFSSFGPTSDGRVKPEVSALGSWARVVYGDEIAYANGTSFSTPMVAGLAAGFWQAFPDFTNMEVIEYLKMTASQANNPDTLIGFGIPNFMSAYNQARINEGEIENKFVVYPNPVTNRRIVYLHSESLEEIATANLAFYDLKGGQISSQEIPLESQRELLEIDVSFLSPGTYILNYVAGSEKQKIKLVVL